MRPACDSVRRARPLLGTFVEITATGRPAATLHAAIDAAFRAIATVHRLMSFHEASSDVSRVNRHAATTAVAVHPWTYAVLTTAADLFRRSDGVFDVTVAPELQALGVLPRAVDESPITTRPRTDRAIELLSGHRVRFGEPGIRIDLGGIAKGFAVDRAIDVLTDAGIPGGLVNAGGDLASFGPDGHRVHLRDPRDPRRVLGTVTVKAAGLATTGGRFDPFIGIGARWSEVVDPRCAAAAPAIVGVTVRAPSCTIADALTKVVMIGGERALAVLDHYRASAMFSLPDGDLTMTSDWADALQLDHSSFLICCAR
jgi:thiamine biosynthesis lipoprotein